MPLNWLPFQWRLSFGESAFHLDERTNQSPIGWRLTTSADNRSYLRSESESLRITLNHSPKLHLFYTSAPPKLLVKKFLANRWANRAVSNGPSRAGPKRKSSEFLSYFRFVNCELASCSKSALSDSASGASGHEAGRFSLFWKLASQHFSSAAISSSQSVPTRLVPISIKTILIWETLSSEHQRTPGNSSLFEVYVRWELWCLRFVRSHRAMSPWVPRLGLVRSVKIANCAWHTLFQIKSALLWRSARKNVRFPNPNLWLITEIVLIKERTVKLSYLLWSSSYFQEFLQTLAPDDRLSRWSPMYRRV